MMNVFSFNTHHLPLKQDCLLKIWDYYYYCYHHFFLASCQMRWTSGNNTRVWLLSNNTHDQHVSAPFVFPCKSLTRTHTHTHTHMHQRLFPVPQIQTRPQPGSDQCVRVSISSCPSLITHHHHHHPPPHHQQQRFMLMPVS